MSKPKMPHLGHAKHLCYLANIDYPTNHTRDYRALVKNAHYICKKCGRVAARPMNLCSPAKL